MSAAPSFRVRHILEPTTPQPDDSGTNTAFGQTQQEVAALYRERALELRMYAYSVTRNQELANDALQEAFMRYFIARCAGNRISAPRAWLYRVMHNYLEDRRSEYGSECSLSSGSAYVSPGPEQNPERECLHRELLGVARKALSAREYRCLQLREEGMEYGEIAGVLKLRAGTVGAMLSRAIHKIRNALKLQEQETA